MKCSRCRKPIKGRYVSDPPIHLKCVTEAEALALRAALREASRMPGSKDAPTPNKR